MKKRVIMQGDAKVIDVIIRENKIRTARGDVKFIEFPGNEKEVNFYDDEIDTSETPKRRKSRKEQSFE